jgi:Holliday junction resolvase RusA-like endonuclease
MQAVLSINLPLPPSANACWRNGAGGKGRFRTAEYLTWIGEAELIGLVRLRGSGIREFGKGYSIKISAGMNRRRDLDNIAKPVIDTLVKAFGGALPDDRWCDRIELDREGPDGRVHVTIVGGEA